MKHLTITDFSPENWHLYEIEPDPDFSPEHNYAVMQDIIDEAKKLRVGLSDKVVRSSEDRADMLSSFAKYKLDDGGGKQIEEFLGKARMKEIYGAKLFEKIKRLESVERLKKVKQI